MNLSYPYIYTLLQHSNCRILASSGEGWVPASHRRLIHSKRNQQNFLYKGYSLSEPDRDLIARFLSINTDKYYTSKKHSTVHAINRAAKKRLSGCPPFFTMLNGNGKPDRFAMTNGHKAEQTRRKRKGVLNTRKDTVEIPNNTTLHIQGRTDSRPVRIIRSIGLSRKLTAELC